MNANPNRHKRIFKDNLRLSPAFLKKFNLTSIEITKTNLGFEDFVKGTYLRKISRKYDETAPFRVNPRQHLLSKAQSDRILKELLQGLEIYDTLGKKYAEFRDSFRNYVSYMLEKFILRILKKTK